MNNSEIRNVTKEVLKGKYKNVMLPFILATLLLGLAQSQDLYSYFMKLMVYHMSLQLVH